MKLNTLKPAEGSTKNRTRVGRGIGSGHGKTGGRGHKGQKARSGGYHKVGFEGGQMPLQRRVPKQGFSSKVSLSTEEIRLHELNGIESDKIDLAVLKALNLVNKSTLRAKIIKSGEITKPVTVVGLKLTKGAREAIEKAGGKIED